MPKVNPREVTDPEELARLISHKDWFSNMFARDYLGSIPKRLSVAKSEEKKRAVLAEAHNATVLYLFLIYKIYPLEPGLKQSIDSSNEHSSNFKALKAWFDSTGGKDAAEIYVRQMQEEFKR